MSTPSGRIFGLDLLRAIAVSAVLLSHSRFWLRSLSAGSERLRVFGFVGVELFFVLSGFLIGGILIRHLSKDPSVRGLLVFWLRRWFRTLPNYYLFLIVNILIAGASVSVPIATYAFFVQGLAWPSPKFFGEAWSLAVEEWFYLSFPLLLWLLHRRLKLRTAVWITCLLMVVASTAGRFFAVVYDDAPFNTIRKIVVLRLDALMFGVLAAYLKIFHERLWRWLARTSMPVGVVLLLLVIGLYGVLERQWLDTSVFGRTFYFSCTSLGVLLLLPWLDSWQTCRAAVAPLIERLSLWSYSMYLANLPVVALLEQSTWLSPDARTWPLGLAVFLLLTTGVSAVLFTHFEIRMTKLRERFG